MFHSCFSIWWMSTMGDPRWSHSFALKKKHVLGCSMLCLWLDRTPRLESGFSWMVRLWIDLSSGWLRGGFGRSFFLREAATANRNLMLDTPSLATLMKVCPASSLCQPNFVSSVTSYTISSNQFLFHWSSMIKFQSWHSWKFNSDMALLWLYISVSHLECDRIDSLVI